MKRTTFALTGVAILACAGLVIASTPKKGDDKKSKGKYKHYQVISMKDGKMVEIDTLLPMSSDYSVESFLADNNIESKDIDIVKIPAEGDLFFEEFMNEDGDPNKKMIVKSEIRIETDDENIEDGDIKKEEVQIICKMDEEGNMVAKKIVNGKEVELTEEELENMKMHHHVGAHGDKNKKVMIMIDDEEMDMDDLHKDLMEKVHMELKDLDIDIDLGSHMNKDSLMKVIHEEMEKLHGEMGEMKVIVKELKAEGNDDGGQEKLVIIKDGEKMEWNSKDGENVFVEIEADGEEDFTIVIVTEGVDKDEVDRSTSISDPEVDFNVFPNPSNGVFTLKFDQKNKAKTAIEITDLQGKVVFEEDLGKVSGDINKKIDISNHGKGVYLINLISGKNKASKRVIVK